MSNNCFEDNKANIQRESGIELLRILAAMAVVVLHIRGGWETTVLPHTVNYYVYWIIEVLCAAAVNSFLLITGYFSVEKESLDLWKPFELYLKLVICREVISVVMAVAGIRALSCYEIVTKLFPTNYYVTLYIGLMFLVPYINRLMAVLDDNQFKLLIIVLVILLSVWPTFVDSLVDLGNISLPGANTISSEGSAFGQTLIHFIFIYVMGAALQRFKIKLKSLHCIQIVFASNMMLTVFGIAYLSNGADVSKALSYANPLLISEAIGFFMLFKNMTIKSKIINILAGGSFMTYILHGYFLQYVSIENIVNENVLYVIARTGILLVCIYLVCFICEMIYELSVGKVLGMVKSRTSRHKSMRI